MAITQFFPHYAGARNDEKLLAVRMKYKIEGYGIYFAILERMLETKDYIVLTDYSIIAFDFRVDSGKVKSIVEDFGLFELTEDGKYFYSERFLSHMDYKDEVSKKRTEAGRKGGLKKAENSKKSQESSKSLANAKQTPSKPLPLNETKQNKTKRDETKQNHRADFDIFESVWALYPNKKNKKGVSKKSKQAIEKLGLDQMILAIDNYKKDVEHQRLNGFKDLNYMYGSTFFNGRYEDYLDESNITPLNPKSESKGGYMSGTEKTRAVIEQMYREGLVTDE